MACLRTKEDNYCCLGVLADIIDPKAWSTNGRGNYEWNGMLAFLSDETYKDIGMSLNGDVELMVKNDKGETFNAIADYIEENL